MTETSWVAKTLWIVALALLAVAFVVVASRGLQRAFGPGSDAGAARYVALTCDTIEREGRRAMVRRIDPFAAAAILRACHERAQRLPAAP